MLGRIFLLGFPHTLCEGPLLHTAAQPRLNRAHDLLRKRHLRVMRVSQHGTKLLDFLVPGVCHHSSDAAPVAAFVLRALSFLLFDILSYKRTKGEHDKIPFVTARRPSLEKERVLSQEN